MPDPQRARNLDRAERKFDVMQQLGAELILVCSNVQPAALPDPARAAADLREMAERAARHGLRVGYEALAWGRHVKRWRDAWDIVQEADHPALGLVVDSFHTLALGDDPAGLAEVPGELHLLRAARRRAAAADGRAVVEPPLPQLSRPRRPRRGRVPAGGGRKRLCRTAVLGDFQRRLPRRARQLDGPGRAAVARAGGGGGRDHHPAAAAPLRRDRVRGVRRGRCRGGGAGGLPRHARLPPRRHAPVQGGGPVSPRPGQPGAEPRAGQRGVRALPAARPQRVRHGAARG